MNDAQLMAQQLCAMAGMMLEDASAEAITPSKTEADLYRKLGELHAVNEACAGLLAIAARLARSSYP